MNMLDHMHPNNFEPHDCEHVIDDISDSKNSCNIDGRCRTGKSCLSSDYMRKWTSESLNLAPTN
ncbi:MAG: hypothetical protein ACKPKO_15995 [Candidatus Fonsibacter sp.]